MSSTILDKINEEQLKKEKIVFGVGDSVKVHVKIKEGDKERIQAFSGTVIGRTGHGSTETFTVRRISYGEGVERVFPIHAPSVAKIEVEKPGKVRRAKLFYLRKRTGKTSKIEEQEQQQAPKQQQPAKA